MPSSSSGKTKRRQSLPNDQLEQPGTPTLQPRKRRKVSVEVVDGEEPPPRRSGSVVNVYGSPKRPRRSPPPPTRDLTRIFESLTPASSPSSTPTKLAKRMLARSKTESSIDSHTNSTHLDRTPSLPNIPPKPSTSFSSIATDSPPIRALPTTTRTYAGKSRSFLVALPTQDGLLPDDEDEYSTRESYASLRTRWGVDNSEDDPYPAPPLLASPSRSSVTSTPSGTPRKGKGKAVQDAQPMMTIPNGMMNPLKSITELRSKGESRRFLDEVGYLFEGMEAAGGVGLRRASALEITTKLCDPEFARKAKAADFLSRTWDVFLEAGAGKGEDRVLDTLLAFFAALVTRDPADLIDLAQRTVQVPPLEKEKGKQKLTEIEQSVVDTLFSLLNAYSSRDPLALVSSSLKDGGTQDTELKKMGVQKKDRALFQTIYNTISKSSLFPPDTPISITFLITHALQTLPPSLIPPHHLPTLLTSLHTTLSPLLAHSSSTPSWPDATHDTSFENIYYHLRMLDMYLLGQWDATSTVMPRTDESGHGDDDDTDNTNDLPTKAMDSARSWLANALVGLGVRAEIQGGASSSLITEITLRVLVSLTHGDAGWARGVVNSECAGALAWVVRVVMRSEWSVRKRGAEGEGKGKGKVKKEEVEIVENQGDVDEEETQALDRLCLALGLLTNLVQVVEETKDLLREIRLHPSCTLENRSCIQQCTCTFSSSSPHRRKPANDTSLSALDVLMQLYAHQLPPSTSTTAPSIPIKKESSPSLFPSSQTPRTRTGTGTGTGTGPGTRTAREGDTPDASFLRVHLAVLFGLLMQGNQTNQTYILGLLGDLSEGVRTGERVRVGLERLVKQAREFAAFYAVVNASGRGRHVGGDGEVETETEAIKESKVARDVVLFLESLRSEVGT